MESGFSIDSVLTFLLSLITGLIGIVVKNQTDRIKELETKVESIQENYAKWDLVKEHLALVVMPLQAQLTRIESKLDKHNG